MLLIFQDHSTKVANKAKGENIDDSAKFLYKSKNLKNLINSSKSQNIGETFLTFKAHIAFT